MITHEEAIKIMQVLESDDAYYNERIEEHKKIAEYISQQENLQTEHEALKKDVARYFELSHNPKSNTNPNEIRPYIEWANELSELEKQILSKVGKEE